MMQRTNCNAPKLLLRAIRGGKRNQSLSNTSISTSTSTITSTHGRQIRWKNTSSKNDKSRLISRSLKKAQQNQPSSNGGHLFGLRPVDVSILPPLHRPPPPPPPKPGAQRLVFPLSLLTLIGTTAYFYFNNKNDSYDYWEAMQTGGVLPGTYDEDDDDEDDDDEFEDDEE